jgi:hypothetical protein
MEVGRAHRRRCSTGVRILAGGVRRFFNRRAPTYLGTIVFLVWAAWSVLPRLNAPEPLPAMTDLVGLLERGDHRSIALAGAQAREHATQVLPALLELLTHPDPRVRAGACQVLGTLGDIAPALDSRAYQELAAVLLPRAGDANWQVRAKAIGALSRLHPLSSLPPLRNTPLDERERNLLGWLEEHDASVERPLQPRLCDVYVNPGYVEFGRPLAGRCLACHAGKPAVAPAADAACRACHADIHEQWSRSAHANSLSHLHLWTVDPVTRESGWMDFGDIQGIACTQCHEPAAWAGQGRGTRTPSALRLNATAGAKGKREKGEGRKLAHPEESFLPSHFSLLTSPPPEPHPRGPGMRNAHAYGVAVKRPEAGCVYRFQASPAGSDTCIPCHTDTHGQWQEWLSGRQPRRVDWPPGEVNLEAREDRRTCVDCHMHPHAGSDGRGRFDHSFAARRDLKLLREGLDFRLGTSAGTGGEIQIRLVLTNLAGHAYPTGTCRRGLEVQAGPGGAERLKRVALLATDCPGPIGGGTGETQPALQPGEQRIFTVLLPKDTESVAFRIVYIRNRQDQDSYTIDIFNGRHEVGGWGPGRELRIGN